MKTWLHQQHQKMLPARRVGQKILKKDDQTQTLWSAKPAEKSFNFSSPSFLI